MNSCDWSVYYQAGKYKGIVRGEIGAYFVINMRAASGAPSYRDLYFVLESKFKASPEGQVDPIIEVLTRKP